MCGIFAAIIQDIHENSNSKKVTFESLKLLEYRGYDSFGILSTNLKNKKLNLEKVVGRVSESKINFRDNYNISLGHTRWATHGKVSGKNTHPHISNNNNYVIVHNGIFENYKEIKDILIKNKYIFKSETDTEVLVNYFEYLESKNKRQEFIKNIKGSNAFVILNLKNKNIFLYKNGSALYLGKDTKNNIFIASDEAVLSSHVNYVHELMDGEFIELHYDKDKYIDNSINFKLLNKELVHDKDLLTLNSHKHWTIKEIFDQKFTIEKAYGKEWPKITLKGKNIIFTGCGTAYNVCLLSKYLGALKGYDINTIPANEFQSFEKLINKDTILFAISQSGETADTIIAAKKVLEKGGKVISIVNNNNSILAKIAYKVINIDSGQEIAVASTKAFTAQVSIVLKLFEFKINKDIFEHLSNLFEDKSLHKNIKKVAKNIIQKYKVENMFLIGKGLAAPLVHEISLKIKETCYIHAEGFAAGELKHGVLSLIEKRVVTLVLDLDKEFSQDLESSSIQIKSRDGILFGIGTQNKDYYDDFIKIPDLGDYTFLGGVIVGQMLAYYMSINKKLNPDRPRNLAKSVTVR
jgi:glutamine---fructose-6-phosphate transaminase (isomerizing)